MSTQRDISDSIINQINTISNDHQKLEEFYDKEELYIFALFS